MGEGQDPLLQYRDMKRRFDAAERELASIGHYLAVVGNALSQSPIRLMLSNTHGTDFGAPLDISRATDVPNVPFDKWPDPRAIATKLKEYYQVRDQLRHAASRLGPEDRALLGLH